MGLRKIASMALVAVLVIVGVACSGGSGGNSPPPTTGSDGSVTIHIKAQNTKFDTNRMTVNAGSKVTIVFTNSDTVLHNVAIYRERFGAVPIFRGNLIGRGTVEYTFTAPAAGSYIFQCDLHPEMWGDFIVN